MKKIKKEIETFEKKFSKSLKSAKTDDQIENVRITFLGRNGQINQLMSIMKTLPIEDKREIGPILNNLKQSSENQLAEKKQAIDDAKQKNISQKQKYFDVTAYKPNQLHGSLHIYTKVIEQLEDIFISMGYKVADGPEAETDFFNFQAINIPPDHPARDMQDTFWLNYTDMLLRTHTSSIQVREMKTHGAPIALIAPGRVYRNEATDATHEFVFTQMEGLFIDKNISMSHLLATVQIFLQKLFEKKELDIRVRPSYYPFVEPGVDVDFSCPFCKSGCSICKRTKWIELMGAGLVHPNVLNHGGINPKIYSGFAFGFGIERVIMIKHGINDVRLFHSNSIDFLKQF